MKPQLNRASLGLFYNFSFSHILLCCSFMVTVFSRAYWVLVYSLFPVLLWRISFCVCHVLFHFRSFSFTISVILGSQSDPRFISSVWFVPPHLPSRISCSWQANRSLQNILKDVSVPNTLLEKRGVKLQKDCWRKYKHVWSTVSFLVSTTGKRGGTR